jgi:hypothetical protein
MRHRCGTDSRNKAAVAVKADKAAALAQFNKGEGGFPAIYIRSVPVPTAISQRTRRWSARASRT